MKIKLLNGTEYEVVGTNSKGNTLEIQIDRSVLTAEGAEEAFNKREILSKIEVYEQVKKSAVLIGYVILAEVRLKADGITVVLAKEADKTEKRITDAAAKAVDATTAAEKATEAAAKAKEASEQVGASLEQLTANVDYLAMETGVEL